MARNARQTSKATPPDGQTANRDDVLAMAEDLIPKLDDRQRAALLTDLLISLIRGEARDAVNSRRG